MEELNGRMPACQFLIMGPHCARRHDQRDPLRFLTDFRDEIKAVVNGIPSASARWHPARSMNCSR